jgi:hypothetical protein
VMWRHSVRVGAAASLWMAAVVLMVSATVQGVLVLCGWSLLVAQAAALVTAWEIIAKERVRVETVARIAVRAAVEHVGLHSVPSDSR